MTDTPLSFWSRYGWGAGGALAHEILRLYKIEHLDLSKIPVSYYVISLALILVGGVFAASWEDNKSWKCFYLGVSLPLWLALWSGAH